VIPADDAQAAAGADWARDLHLDDRVVVASDHTPFGRTMADAFNLALGPGQAGVFSQPSLTYLAGRPRVTNDVGMGSDAYLRPPGQDLPDYVTSAALDPSQLPPAGEKFIAGFRDEYKRAPGRYAAYGYEAMAVILDSIDRASDPADRTAVVDAFFETTDRDSVLGTYSIDGLGNTTLEEMTGYRAEADSLVADAELSGR
jgi:ABC-type branched-subunit amino acid transport system substrate-binding protein